ncbi:oligosaccharide flippase family protein [Roseospira marina]|uniref:Oligosaccharide flippase family protein n=1 Tax=Roseospira marina TaxID=140057 RepID=A0A5M6IDU9_9PROT|nr:polysaccharide biosynthesis C-terminal domain-containing protein [Roseospira marina]KAA5606446.1 oligosaccharide flippase family protein [Roseospira marina]MBB4314139.1 O-antigen/teichoic acid export membrane protein [Roseospira marina]MBB5087300.1 O-antigen/teichoic acid export membrane protein [Roseospira marina]
MAVPPLPRGRVTPTALVRLAAYALDAGLPAVFGLCLMIAVARGASVEAFGAFALVLAIAGVQTPVAVLGLAGLFYGRAASRPSASNRLYWPGVVVVLGSGAGLYMATLAVLWVLAGPLLLHLYALAGLRVLGAAAEPLRAIYQARSRPDAYVPIRIGTVAVAALVAAFAFVLQADVVWYAAIWGLEWLLFAAVLLGASLRRGICPPVRHPRVGPVMVKAAPLLVQAICIAIYMRFDQIYVGWRFGAADLSAYAAAARIAEAGNMAYGVLAAFLCPRIIREWRAGRLAGDTKAVLVLIGVGTVGVSGVGALWGDTLLAGIFGPAYAAGGLILAVYVLSTGLTVYSTFGSRLNVAQGATLPGMISGLVGAVSNVGLSVLLCEVQGPLGAATATVLSYGLTCMVLWYAVWRRTSMTRR